MFELREYIKKGFMAAVGKMSDYKIILNSAGWMEKGVLTEEDLEEINAAIEAQYIVKDAVSEGTAEDILTEETNTESDGATEPETTDETVPSADAEPTE